VKIDDKKFEITPIGITATQEVTKNDIMSGFKFFGQVQDKAMVYVGDLAVIAEKQGIIENGKESEFYKDAQKESGLNKNSVQKAKTIMKNVDLLNRFKRCGIRHYELVYQLPPEKQKEMLEKCINEGWSTKRLKNEVFRLTPDPEMPNDKFNVICADPPWAYDTEQSSKEVSKHYRTMELEDLIRKGEEVQKVAYKNCVLYLWATTGRLDWAFPVIEAWGFKYKTSMVWDKVDHNMGHYCSARHELLLIAGKGQSTPKDSKLANSIDSVQSIQKSRIHSKKPEEFYKIIEQLYPDANKLEMYGRGSRPGWTVWGDEA
jgi:N6-adenosine-specific RNA methylase IME4